MSLVRSHLALLAAVLFVCACGGSQLGPPYGAPSSEGDATGDHASEDGDPGFLPASQVGTPGAARTEILTDPGELPTLKVAADGDKPLPLQHTGVKATLAGFTADVEVAQTYDNPYKTAIEASYIFPLPENAAVYSMKMIIGDRVIEAVVKERGAARRTYERARAAGQTAALLEQERPNVFTQSVANIEPGKKIEVVLRYVQDLSYDAGEYEFVFPMVVGPRYIPGTPLDGAEAGKGTYADTTLVPDASRITPPYLGKGQRSGHDISIDVVASGAGVVSTFAVPTHDVKSESRPDGAIHLQLAGADTIPNRDFVMRYRVAGPKPVATLYSTGRDKGAFSLVLQPPALDVEKNVGKRELVFVVDVSGSMTGAPLGLCKAAMRTALQGMRPVDTFNVITFAGSTGRLFPKPRPASDATIRTALGYIDRLSAGGGTEMLDAIAAALTPDVEAGRRRYVFFMTDGEVGNDEKILASTRTFVSEIEKKGGGARVFGFGAGSSVNRNLLGGLAREGKGLTVYVTNREDPDRAVNRFYRYIDRTILRKVRVDYGAATTFDVFPAELPDLFASHPMIVHGRYKGALTGPITIRATSGDGEVTIPVTIARAPADDGWPLQDLLWARAKIGSLEGDLWSAGNPSTAQQGITELGIQYHLATLFTSFVAVDNSKVVGDGHPVHVVQPVQVPEGVDGKAAGARTTDGDEPSCSMCDTIPPSGGPSSGGGEYGYEFSDDPLAAGGFGPSDATIRVRPGSSSINASSSDRNRLDMAVMNAQSAAPPPVHGPRGCNCGVVGESESPLDDGSGHSPPHSRAAWAVLGAALLLARRRSRRGAPSRRFPPNPRRAAASHGAR